MMDSLQLDVPKSKRKNLLYPDFTNRPDQKTNSLNPGDSANPNTAKCLCFSAKICLKCNNSCLLFARRLPKLQTSPSPALTSDLSIVDFFFGEIS
jgi:hypothetical protein